MLPQQTSPASLRVSSGFQSSMEYDACNIKGLYVPSTLSYDLSASARSQASSVVGDVIEHTESHPLVCTSMDIVDRKQVV